MLRPLEELRALVEGYLGELAFTPELGGLEEAVRYPLEAGGKLYRPVIALAVGESAGAAAEHVLPAAAAVELVHTFSLVHDDLPALDDDDERRGRPSAHVAFGEATALLAGDALLAEAFRLALSYPTPMVGRELAQATLAMIGGQYRDVTGDAADLAALHRLKTGALFSASVGVALWVAEVPETEQPAWRAFGDELGLLFQIVDDLLDGDGYAEAHGIEEARRLADEAAGRAQARLEAIPADTSVLAEIVSSPPALGPGLAPRVEQRLSLVTLGVGDLARSRAFYEALGWTTGAAPGRRRGLLPDGRDDRRALGPGNSPRTAASRTAAAGAASRSRTTSARPPRSTRSSPRRRPPVHDPTPRRRDLLGRLLGRLRRSRRAPLGGRAQPWLDDRRRRLDDARQVTDCYLAVNRHGSVIVP